MAKTLTGYREKFFYSNQWKCIMAESRVARSVGWGEKYDSNQKKKVEKPLALTSIGLHTPPTKE